MIYKQVPYEEDFFVKVSPSSVVALLFYPKLHKPVTRTKH